MKRSRDQFQAKSPSKLIEKASNYTKNLDKYHQLPRSNSKSMAVSQLAQYQREYIEFVVNNVKEQQQLFRKKESNESQLRSHYESKINEGILKVKHNEKQISKKKEKQAEVYNKHLVNVYKRYEEEEKKHRQSQKQQTYKLRKQLQEFYAKQEQRKKEAEHRQVKVGTEYQKAVERINKIHQQSQLFSNKAQVELDLELKKNSHYNEILLVKKRKVSNINEDKQKIMNQSLSLFRDRQNRFIQKYGRNQASSIEAWKHIEDDCSKTKKRLNEFFKRRVQKWASEKKRIDATNSQTPQKCLDILDKTSKSAFRKTVSTFRNSFLGWEQTVKKNKSQIKEVDEMKKVVIMNTHLDLRFTNNSSFKIREKMNSYRHHASDISNAYL